MTTPATSSLFRSALNETIHPKWVLGLAVATPVCAIMQGTMLLSEYRKNHANAPRPIMPSRGVVVVNPQDRISSSRATTNNNVSLPQHMATSSSSSSLGMKQPPLRLLVIGDSLAAGVGMSKSGTPVMPESIAKALSKASGGRAVYWTCVGTPGVTASQIVRDIEGLNEERPLQLEKRLAEWQETRRRAEEWWQQRKQKILLSTENSNNGRLTVRGKVSRWWGQVRQDVRELKAVVVAQKKQQQVDETSSRATVEKKNGTIDADFVGQYDIAVVLTGLNDLKNTFLPFMMRGANAASDSEGEKRKSNGLGDELTKMLHALAPKLKFPIRIKQTAQKHQETDPAVHADRVDGDENTPSSSNQEESDHRRRPLVVFPALPTSALPLCRMAPLSWFMSPLIRTTDDTKKLLAEMFPDLVLFVESPSSQLLADIEEGRGPLARANRSTEEVLLKFTDVAQSAREQVENFMKHHYQGWITDAEEQQQNQHEDVLEDSEHYHRLYHKQPKAAPGSSLISADNIHPNDEGYEIWGRHIAAAIVQAWDRELP